MKKYNIGDLIKIKDYMSSTYKNKIGIIIDIIQPYDIPSGSALEKHLLYSILVCGQPNKPAKVFQSQFDHFPEKKE